MTRQDEKLDLAKSANWSKEDWDAYAKYINDSVRKPDQYAGLSPEMKERLQRQERMRALEKLFVSGIVLACAAWIVSRDLLLLVPVLGIVGGIKVLYRDDK